MSRKNKRRYPPRQSDFKNALYRNNAAYNNYFNLLLNICLSQFEYKNFPLSFNIREFESSLFYTGACAVFKDPDITSEFSPFSDGSNLFCLPVQDFKNYDIYGDPVNYTVVSKLSNYRIALNNKNSVICYNDRTHTSFLDDIENFCYRLYNIDRIIDININGQKEPVVLQGSKNQILTLKNMWMKYDGNEPVVIVDEGLDLDSAIKNLTSKVEFKADKLFQVKKDIWNEALTYIGVSNVNINKNERLVSDEVLRSMGGSIAARFSRTDERKSAIEKVNKMFGTEIQVEFRETTDTFHTNGGNPFNVGDLNRQGFDDL